MKDDPAIQTRLLSQMHERLVLQKIREMGPISRPKITQELGVTPPTVYKAVDSLLEAELLEEETILISGERGRPAKKVRLSNKLQVIGMEIDFPECQLVAGSLTGETCLEETSAGTASQLESFRFATPECYEEFLHLVTDGVSRIEKSNKKRIAGIGISMPGLINSPQQRGVLSPNVPMTNGRSPSLDLSELLQIPVIMFQESHALCIAERSYGNARQEENYAILDLSTGIGLGVVSGGRFILGKSGLAGEIGHIPVEPNGLLCGCGRRGCLETVAGDRAFLARLNQQQTHQENRPLSMDEVFQLINENQINPQPIITEIAEHLAFAITIIINLYNPSMLFIHSKMFDLQANLLEMIIEKTGQRALGPSFEACQIERAQGTKWQGALAGVIDHIMDSVAPSLG